MYNDNPQPTETYGVLATLVTSAKVPDETRLSAGEGDVRQFRRVQEAAPGIRESRPAKMVKDGISAPLHAGAAKYYKEKGWMK